MAPFTLSCPSQSTVEVQVLQGLPRVPILSLQEGHSLMPQPALLRMLMAGVKGVSCAGIPRSPLSCSGHGRGVAREATGVEGLDWGGDRDTGTHMEMGTHTWTWEHTHTRSRRVALLKGFIDHSGEMALGSEGIRGFFQG